MEKINKPIIYSETLDLGPYLTDSVEKREKEMCKYKLFAVIVHCGYDLFGGHYYAFVRGLNGSWYEANDESINQVSSNEIFKKNAYILLYQNLNLAEKRRREGTP